MCYAYGHVMHQLHPDTGFMESILLLHKSAEVIRAHLTKYKHCQHQHNTFNLIINSGPHQIVVLLMIIMLMYAFHL